LIFTLSAKSSAFDGVFGSAGADATLAGVALRMSHEAAVFQIGTFVAQSKGCVAITTKK
jgi:hypothetical protein